MNRRRRLFPIVVLAALVAVVLAVVPSSPHAASPPPAPAGLTAIALDGRVSLDWQPAAGAVGYGLFRGTSPTSITQLVSGAWPPNTSYTDTTAQNGTTYYYAVRAYNSDGASPTGQLAQATPRARSCGAGNAIVLENCFPGTTAWKSPGAGSAYPHGIEGFLSASSVEAGESVELRVQADWDAPYRVEVYRTGHYGGDQGRLVSVIPGLRGQLPGLLPQPTHDRASPTAPTGPPRPRSRPRPTGRPASTCSSSSARTTASTARCSLVVRDDGGNSDVLYGVPTSTYQAYNTYGGKSIYDSLSDGPNTVSGAKRAVEVSFDRPYVQSRTRRLVHDWYTRTDLATVSWLERQGYDVGYVAVRTCTRTARSSARQGRRHRHPRRVLVAARCATRRAARDAGTSLVFLGANGVYWKIRFETSAITGVANRVMVGYKTTQSGPVDPSGTTTTTWRDPAGRTGPRTSCRASYIGDNVADSLPAQGLRGRGPRPLLALHRAREPGAGHDATSAPAIVGWEWDERVDNGLEPGGRRDARLLAGPATSSRAGASLRLRPGVSNGPALPPPAAPRVVDRDEQLEPRPRPQRGRQRRAQRAHPAGDGERAHRHGCAPDDARRRPRPSSRPARRRSRARPPHSATVASPRPPLTVDVRPLGRPVHAPRRPHAHRARTARPSRHRDARQRDAHRQIRPRRAARAAPPTPRASAPASRAGAARRSAPRTWTFTHRAQPPPRSPRRPPPRRDRVPTTPPCGAASTARSTPRP